MVVRSKWMQNTRAKGRQPECFDIEQCGRMFLHSHWGPSSGHVCCSCGIHFQSSPPFCALQCKSNRICINQMDLSFCMFQLSCFEAMRSIANISITGIPTKGIKNMTLKVCWKHLNELFIQIRFSNRIKWTMELNTTMACMQHSIEIMVSHRGRQHVLQNQFKSKCTDFWESCRFKPQ